MFGYLRGNTTTKRRISSRAKHGIAQFRMERLLEMMREEMLAGNETRGKRYLEHARRLSMRTKTPLPKGYPYCRACGNPLIPGRNCRVRLRSQRVVYHCLACDAKRRVPYILEKRGAEDGEHREIH